MTRNPSRPAAQIGRSCLQLKRSDLQGWVVRSTRFGILTGDSTALLAYDKPASRRPIDAFGPCSRDVIGGRRRLCVDKYNLPACSEPLEDRSFAPKAKISLSPDAATANSHDHGHVTGLANPRTRLGLAHADSTRTDAKSLSAYPYNDLNVTSPDATRDVDH